MNDKRVQRGFCCFLLATVSAVTGPWTVRAVEERVLPVDEYRERMKAAWVSQMVGVQWGAPTEFKFNDVVMPEANVPEWRSEMIGGAFDNDDLYVEMTFLKTLADHGLDAPIRQAGLDFANSEYILWCANDAGRVNLRKGIAPPDSSHPAYSRCLNDIDYQIEADYAGIISPGCPQSAIALGRTFGRLMNFGDGVWAGQFVGAMYAEAYFTADVNALLDAGLAAIPGESDYAQMVRAGGRVETDAAGRERFVIPRVKPTPDAAKLADLDPTVRVQKALDALFPGWKTSRNAPDYGGTILYSCNTAPVCLHAKGRWAATITTSARDFSHFFTFSLSPSAGERWSFSEAFKLDSPYTSINDDVGFQLVADAGTVIYAAEDASSVPQNGYRMETSVGTFEVTGGTFNLKSGGFKTGAAKLTLADAEKFSGTLDVVEGEVVIQRRRKIPKRRRARAGRATAPGPT